jgi:hypothetical protein
VVGAAGDSKGVAAAITTPQGGGESNMTELGLVLAIIDLFWWLRK